MLRTWQLQLPLSLQMPDDLTQPDPTCCILHMAHNQLIVLTTRPVFFAAVKQAVAQRVVRGEHLLEEAEQGPYLPACSAAAHRNLLLAQRLLNSGRKLLQAGLHFVFNGAVILLLQRLIRSTVPIESGKANVRSTSLASLRDDYEPSIEFAIRCFEEEARTGTHYPRDCCKILQDLNELTDRYVRYQEQPKQQKHTAEYVHPGSFADSMSKFAGDTNASSQLFGEGAPFYAEIMTWVQGDGLQVQDSLYI
jgi:hypothetical protein